MPKKNEWTVSVRKDGGSVRVYRYGKLRDEISPSEDTYESGGATAMKFAQELAFELREQSNEMRRKTADHDVITEPNLKNDATGNAVTGKPSPTTSNTQDKVATLRTENRKMKAQLQKERRRHMFEIKARRGAKLAEILVKRGALEEDANAVKAFVKDVAMMSDEEIGRLERKASGDSEFSSIEEAERAERAYKRESRMLRRKADEAQESGDSETADGFDASADDAVKNAGCCREFIRVAAHKTAAEKGNCKSCGKPNFLCKGCDADDADDKGASTESEDKDASTEGEDTAEKTADHDVQEEPNLKNDAKGVAVTGKPSPNNNTKATGEGTKKEATGKCDDCDRDPCECKKASKKDAAGKCDDCDCDPCECTKTASKKDAAGKCDDCDCDPCECTKTASDEDAGSEEMKPLAESLREQHIATAKMYRKMADEAEESGDFVKADTWDHKAEVCEDLSKDAVIETVNPEPELAGVNDATEIHEASDDSMKREASEGASTEDTDGPSEGSAKKASAEYDDEIEITDDLIEAAVTPRELLELRSASGGQRRREPSRVDPNASGVTRIASCDENAASYDPDIAALESLWEGAPRE